MAMVLEKHTMNKATCKSIRKDGSPCQGQGLEQFDGYCIAHGPTDKLREWRARGGKASSTAARADKRIPERLQGLAKTLTEGITQVQDGTLSPSAYTAICRGARVMVDLYRLADEEMEQIRTDETHAAAAEVAGGHGDLAILNAAAEITAQQNQYRAESFVDQGLATCEEPQSDNRPAEYVLTTEGQRRLGYLRLTEFNQQDIDAFKDDSRQYTFPSNHLPFFIQALREHREDMEEALANLTRDPALDLAPPRDPLTGQPLNELPAGVKIGLPPDPALADVERLPEILKDRIRQVEELTHECEQNYYDEQYDDKRNLYLAAHNLEPGIHDSIVMPHNLN